MDFSRLMAYGNKNKLLETIVGETKEELVSIKATASIEDRVKMQNIVHHLYSSWSIICADGPLRELSRLLKNTSATDEEINMAVCRYELLFGDVVGRRQYQYGDGA